MTDLPALEDVSAPLRRCTKCGVHKPWTAAHFTQQVRRHKDGSLAPSVWRAQCNPCRMQTLRDWDANDKAVKRHDRDARPPVAKALALAVQQLPLPKATTPSLRTELERQAATQHEKLAAKMLKLALGDGKDAAAMLKLVAAYLMGTPREATDDNGPTDFWQALLASAGQRDAGPDADLGAAGADSEHDSGADRPGA